MNLLFCIDRGFIPLLGTCVRSILKNGGYERYEAYVLHSDLTQADQAASAASAASGCTLRS